MADRFRLNLEAPFLRAASDPLQPATAISSDAGFQRPANDVSTPTASRSFVTEKHLRRVPVPQRGQADYTGEAMSRYINGLEARLTDHIRKHAPRWHDAEPAASCAAGRSRKQTIQRQAGPRRATC